MARGTTVLISFYLQFKGHCCLSSQEISGCGLPGSSPNKRMIFFPLQVEPIEVAAIYSRRSSLWLAATLALVRQGVPFVWMGCELSKGREKEWDQLQHIWVCPKTVCTSEWPEELL